MQKFSFLFFLVFLSNINLKAQFEDSELKFWGDCLSNLFHDEYRKTANQKFYSELKKDLLNSGFENNYADLEFMKVFYPPDSLFRLLNWQLKLDEYRYDYFGIIQFSNGSIIELRDASKSLGRIEKEELHPDEWFGAFYYNFVPITNEEEEYYLLFGINKFNAAYDYKVCDVLKINEEKISFGKPIFVKEREDARDEIKKRLILQYSDPAYVQLQMDSSKQVISYNNIILIPEASFMDEPMLAQDGTYEIYRSQGNIWKYEEFLFDQNITTPARDFPSTKEERDIIGRKRREN